MKSRTKRFHLDIPRAPIALLGAAMLMMVGCAGLAHLGSEFGNHPAALVGEWIDSVKTTPGDTSLWVLGPSGSDGFRRIRAASGDAAAADAGASEVRHYGSWYLSGNLADAAGRALCFTNRPGRSAPTCRPFDLDSVASGAGLRRRLVIRSYQGGHSVADRVLLART